MDLLPTIASLSGKPLPQDRKIDGHDISETFKSDESPRDDLVFYSSHGELEGIRDGDWKYLEQTTGGRKNTPKKTQTFLFNLADDIGEQSNLVDQKPDVVARLKSRMKEMDDEITANARPVWRVGE